MASNNLKLATEAASKNAIFGQTSRLLSKKPFNILEDPNSSRGVENIIAIWLDSNIDESDIGYRHMLNRLRAIINLIYSFTDANECVDFLTEIEHEKVIMVVSGAFGQPIIPMIHDIPHLYSVYVFCCDKVKHELWSKEWGKVKEVFNDFEPLYNSVKRDIHICEEDLTSINFCSFDGKSKSDLDEIHHSFMYTQLLKEILLEIDYGPEARAEFATFFREQYTGNNAQLCIIDEFVQHYDRHPPLWWYSRDWFLHAVLNKALRIQDMEIIMKLGFFLRDLHRNIERLYMKSINDQVVITVYRGQGLLNAEFDMLSIKEGGLLSFNCFLSTSTDDRVAFSYAESAKQDPKMTGVFFEIKLYPSIWSSSAFAVLDESTGYFSENEQEILFTMHTVFRIDKIKNIEHRLWRIELTLTEENDPPLKILTDYMRSEIAEVSGWDRLMHLMSKMRKYDQLEKIAENVQTSISEDSWMEASTIAGANAMARQGKGDYINALSFAYKALTIHLKYGPPGDQFVGGIYMNIGLAYKGMANYTAALYYYNKSLSILEACQQPNEKYLAALYNNMGVVQDLMGNHSTAILYYQKVLEIGKLQFPENHPDLAGTYLNIGLAYESMKEYSTAIMFFDKSKKILEKVVPNDHPALLNIHNKLRKKH